ncbi:hypothetical protein AVE44_29510, partial [Salmonella enterica subsp. enterica serovar Typhimurium]|nr:hypothetical protein [Salmonella enterica subsp. enterica serovar Typhimurium]
MQPQVLAAEDVRHAPAPDQLTDPVPPVQGPLLVHRHVRVLVPPAAQAEGVASADEASAPRASAEEASAPRASADGSVVGWPVGAVDSPEDSVVGSPVGVVG